MPGSEALLGREVADNIVQAGPETSIPAARQCKAHLPV
jgi:hypothetical protein